MEDESFSASVETYSHARGFGSVLLEDGRELPFDVSACTHEPTLGEAVRVRIGTSRGGKPKIVFLEPLSAPEAEPTRLPLAAAILRLQEAGIASGLSAALFEHLLEEHFQGDEHETDIVPLLAAYYEIAAADAVIDGWFACDWNFQNDTDDICRDLSARVGNSPLLTLVEIGERAVVDGEYSEHFVTLTARRFDGRVVERDVRSVLDVVSWVNEILAERDDHRRFRQLETDGDWYAFLLLGEETRERLSTWCVLPLLPD
jgi:hypothetical protein